MPYALILIGLMLTVAAVRNKHERLFDLVTGEFKGENSFIYWVAAIALIGAVGYAPGMKGLSNTFLALVLIVLVLSNAGIFQKFTDALKQSTNQQVAA